VERGDLLARDKIHCNLIRAGKRAIMTSLGCWGASYVWVPRLKKGYFQKITKHFFLPVKPVSTKRELAPQKDALISG